MKKLYLAIAGLALALPMSAEACAPSPMCWLQQSPSYAREQCRRADPDYSEDFDEPERLPDFIRGCKKLGVTVQRAKPRAQCSMSPTGRRCS